MIETLIGIARAVRSTMYRVSSSHILGVDFDIVLHFVVSLVIFAWAERRYGVKRAAWILAVLIIAKEIVDIFLKSQLAYIRRPTPPMVIDIVTDVLTGLAGGLTMWLIIYFRRRATPA